MQEMENRFPFAVFASGRRQNVRDTVTKTCTVQENESQWEVSAIAGA